MPTGAIITVSNNRLLGEAGMYASVLGLKSFNTPRADVGISLRLNTQGEPDFIALRIVNFGEFSIGIDGQQAQGYLVLDTINGAPAGATLLDVYTNLSAALCAV